MNLLCVSCISLYASYLGRGDATAVSANGNHILAIKLHDSEQQLGNHMELNKPSILQNKSPCTDLYFLIPKQTRAEEKKKVFFSADC